VVGRPVAGRWRAARAPVNRLRHGKASSDAARKKLISLVWVEGLRAVAHQARDDGNITLAEALEVTRFEVYEAYLDEELDRHQSQAAARRSR
jgi:hypothetical protein